MVEVDELQQKLNTVELYIDIGGKSEEFQKKLVNTLTGFGFQASPRAEGYAFFPGDELGWKGLPSLRLTIVGTVFAIRIHASDTLTKVNASMVNATPDDVYRRIMGALVQAKKVYEEYGRKAACVFVGLNVNESPR